jgi:hypothetical protein
VEDKIQLIIAQYEEEKLRLQQWIRGFVDEADYLAAHYHTQALYRLNHQLYTLKSLDDKLYKQKFSLENTIEGLKRLLEKEEFAHAHAHFEQKMLDTLKKLEDLNKISSKPAAKENEAILGQALKALFDREIKNLKLILNKKDNLYLRFSYANKTLKLSLPHVKQHVNELRLHHEKIPVLTSLGFCLSANQSVFTLLLKGDKEDVLSRLNRILVKIVYEVFSLQDFKNESYIQYTEIHLRR